MQKKLYTITVKNHASLSLYAVKSIPRHGMYLCHLIFKELYISIQAATITLISSLTDKNVMIGQSLHK